MSHPIYLPSAAIQPGNTSYRASSPASSDPDIHDEGSDLELDDEAYARKVEAELKLGLPSAAEIQAEKSVLVTRPTNMKEERGAERQNAAHQFLRDKHETLNRGDRFRATNLYAPPAPAAKPTVSAFPLTGPTMPPQVTQQTTAGVPTRHYDHSWRHYALPAEPPMTSVPIRMDGGSRVDSLIMGAIEADRRVAESARLSALGGVGVGDRDHSRVDSSGHETTGGDSVSTVGQDTLPTRMI